MLNFGVSSFSHWGSCYFYRLLNSSPLGVLGVYWTCTIDYLGYRNYSKSRLVVLRLTHTVEGFSLVIFQSKFRL